jgi:hypothetical protein
LIFTPIPRSKYRLIPTDNSTGSALVGTEKVAETGITTETKVVYISEIAKSLLHSLILVGCLLNALQISISMIGLMRPTVDTPESGNGFLKGFDGRVCERLLVNLE